MVLFTVEIKPYFEVFFQLLYRVKYRLEIATTTIIIPIFIDLLRCSESKIFLKLMLFFFFSQHGKFD